MKQDEEVQGIFSLQMATWMNIILEKSLVGNLKHRYTARKNKL